MKKKRNLHCGCAFSTHCHTVPQSSRAPHARRKTARELLSTRTRYSPTPSPPRTRRGTSPSRSPPPSPPEFRFEGMSTVSTARSRRRALQVVVDLDAGSPVVGSWSSQHEALIPAGTRASPIDVEALDDLDDERRSRGTRRRHPVVVVDLELDTDQEGCDDAGTTFPDCSGSKRRRVPPVICLSPDREERAIIQQKDAMRVSRAHAEVAPKEPIFTCPVCLNKLDQPSTTKCGHIFCEKCIKASIKAQKKCPTCRKSLGTTSYHRVYLPATADQGCC